VQIAAVVVRADFRLDPELDPISVLLVKQAGVLYDRRAEWAEM
jgi:hypothetical protein